MKLVAMAAHDLDVESSSYLLAASIM